MPYLQEEKDKSRGRTRTLGDDKGKDNLYWP